MIVLIIQKKIEYLKLNFFKTFIFIYLHKDFKKLLFSLKKKKYYLKILNVYSIDFLLI